MSLKVNRKVIWLLGILAMAVVVLATACGGDDDDGGSRENPFGGNAGSGSGASGSSTNGSGSSPVGQANTNGAGRGSCSVKLTGDVNGEFKGSGDSGAVGTDYWLTEDEIRSALTFLQTGTDAEKKKKVEEAMAQDPRIFLLILNCEADKVSISFLPSSTSKYKDVPFKKSGEYPVPAGGALGGAEEPGEFAALTTIDDVAYQVAKDGSLKITKFDESGISGTFQFGIEEFFAEGTAKKAQVSGEFTFPCSGGKVCK